MFAKVSHGRRRACQCVEKEKEWGRDGGVWAIDKLAKSLLTFHVGFLWHRTWAAISKNKEVSC